MDLENSEWQGNGSSDSESQKEAMGNQQVNYDQLDRLHVGRAAMRGRGGGAHRTDAWSVGSLDYLGKLQARLGGGARGTQRGAWVRLVTNPTLVHASTPTRRLVRLTAMGLGAASSQ
jgi:hypothetical protein